MKTLTTATQAQVLARFFRVLGDPTRLALIRELEGGERSVGQLVAAVAQPQPRVSTHLACLRHCGFAIAERRGKEGVFPPPVGGKKTPPGGGRRGPPPPPRGPPPPPPRPARGGGVRRERDTP